MLDTVNQRSAGNTTKCANELFFSICNSCLREVAFATYTHWLSQAQYTTSASFEVSYITRKTVTP